jgi:soluble lytic murein transglycosylase-like protein
MLNVKIPEIKESFYNLDSAKLNKDKIVNVIRPKFGKYIQNISEIAGVPSELIDSFIFIESAGNENAQSPYGAIGLMQLNGATASDTLVFEKGAGRLQNEEAEIIKKYLGNRYSLIEKVKPNQKSIGKTFINKNDLLKPELNILIGSILLKQLCDEFTENGKVRLDKVVAIYNGGRYSKSSKKIILFKGSTSELLNLVPKETSAYITKLVGTNGLLDILV